MARPSKLSENQWLEIERRVIAGETYRSLGKEFGVTESAIRQQVSARAKLVKAVANQIVETERAFMALPVSSQIYARSLADELKAISSHLAGAAKYGAMTAHKLSHIANEKAEEIDPLTVDIESLGTIAALTRTANEAGKMGIELIKATKDTAAEDEPPEPKRVMFVEKDCSVV